MTRTFAIGFAALVWTGSVARAEPPAVPDEADIVLAQADLKKGGLEDKRKARPLDKRSGKPDKRSGKLDKRSDKLDKRSDKFEKRSDKLDARGKDKRAERLDQRADKMDERADKLDERAAGKEAHDARKLNRADRIKQIKVRASQRRSARAQRRASEKKQARMKAKAVLKGKAMDPALQEEMKRHARRSARLERVREIAADKDDFDTVQRVDSLLDKERARHAGWMTRYEVTGVAQ